VAALMRGDWRAAWNGLKQIAKGATIAILALTRGFGRLIVVILKGAWNLVKAGAAASWRMIVAAVRAGVSNVISAAHTLPGRIVSALGSLGSLLYNAGATIIQGLISGITDKLSSLWKTVSGIAGKIKALKGPLSYDKVLLNPAGVAIMQGLISGIESQRAMLKKTLRGVTTDLVGGVSGAAFPALALSGGYGGASGGRGVQTAVVEQRIVYENHYHVHPPGGTAVIGSADDVARMIAPYITKHQGKAEAGSGRQR